MAEMESFHEQPSRRLTKSSPDNHKIPPEYHDFIAGAVGGSLREGFKIMLEFCSSKSDSKALYNNLPQRSMLTSNGHYQN